MKATKKIEFYIKKYKKYQMNNPLIGELVAALTKLDIMIKQNTKMIERLEKMVNEIYNAPPYGPGYVAAEKKIAFLNEEDSDEPPILVVGPFTDENNRALLEKLLGPVDTNDSGHQEDNVAVVDPYADTNEDYPEPTFAPDFL